MTRIVRKTSAIIMGVGAFGLVLIALTVPMIVAAGPAILAIGVGGGAYILWPKGR